MLTAIRHESRWSWCRLLDLLEHSEANALQQSCKEVHTAIQAAPGGAVRNLHLNELTKAAEILARAAAIPALTASVRRISFEFCNHLQNFDLVPLGQFKELTALNLNACKDLTDSAIEIVTEQCLKLQRLELYWDVVLTDISATALASAAFAPLLTHLNISGCKHFTDEATVPFLRRCSSLTFLDMTRCEDLGDASMAAIGESCRQLRTLVLYATPNITDVGFEAMAPGLPNLTHLTITGMKLITDRSIMALAKGCPELRVLDCMWVTPLTDASLIALGNAPLKHLTMLSIHGNVNVTRKGMEALAKGCRSIEQMDINGCRNLGLYRSKDEMQKLLPNFKKFILL